MMYKWQPACSARLKRTSEENRCRTFGRHCIVDRYRTQVCTCACVACKGKAAQRRKCASKDYFSVQHSRSPERAETLSCFISSVHVLLRHTVHSNPIRSKLIQNAKNEKNKSLFFQRAKCMKILHSISVRVFSGLCATVNLRRVDAPSEFDGASALACAFAFSEFALLHQVQHVLLVVFGV